MSWEGGYPLRISMSVVRTAARLAVAQTSLRQVAREVGMRPTGLSTALRSNNPRLSTRLKLAEWYVRRSATLGTKELSTISAALDLLLAEFPPARRKELETRILGELEKEYRGMRPDLPTWLVVLTRQNKESHRSANDDEG